MPISKQHTMRIGIDVGGVMVQHDSSVENYDRKEDTNFDPTQVPWMEGLFQALDALKADGHELFIVSFCGARREAETRAALKARHVSNWIPEQNWFFTRDRKLKVKVCRDQGLQFMIDDRLDILQSFPPESSVHLIWFNPGASVQHGVKKVNAPKRIIHCDDWQSVAERIKVLASCQ